MPQVYLNLQTRANLLILSHSQSQKKNTPAYLCNTLWNFSLKNRRFNESVVHCSSYRLISLNTISIIDTHFCNLNLETRLVVNISPCLKWGALKESYFRMRCISRGTSRIVSTGSESHYTGREPHVNSLGGWRLRAISTDLMSGLWFERIHDRHDDRTRSD